MRIEQLEYVVAVTRHGSLRKASEHLHLSQPALSEAVAKLEAELGVTLLDRRRQGSRISRQGRELLEHIVEVLESVDRLRIAAGDQALATSVIRLGTVNAATTGVLVPALRRFGERHHDARVEVVSMTHDSLADALHDGAVDLGLVNVMDGDEVPDGLASTTLLHGRPMAVLPADHPLAARSEVGVEDLLAEQLVLMRPGYLMHRYAHRLLGGVDGLRSTHSTDGAEMGKLMVAQGLGITLLPDYSVLDDPMHTAGILTARPIAGDRTTITLLMLHRSQRASRWVRDLRAELVSAAAATSRGQL